MQIIPGPYKRGERMIVDKEFQGGYEAEVIYSYKHFSRIKVEEFEWEVMTYRLSPLPSLEEDKPFKINCL